jgi:hypothetical protein
MSVINFKEIQEEKGTKICSICKSKFVGFGHNPQPFYNLKVEDRCCDDCNKRIVITRREKELNREIN